MPTECVPEDARDVEEFILNEVLHGVHLDPRESQTLLSYTQERHHHLFGPFTTYFVLGSYEQPFRFRLGVVLTELNSRLNAYAYLMAPQPDPDLPERLPTLKIKFYLHALYADWIPLVLEHNTGGALVEFGRADRPFLFDRTYVFPRGYESLRDDTVDSAESLESVDEVLARSVELAYEADHREALFDSLDELVEQQPSDGETVTVDDLTEHLERELGGRVVPSYSGVITDGIEQYEAVDRCLPWTTEDELRARIELLP